MPVITHWFDEERSLPWELHRESPWTGAAGEEFHSFPLTSLLPYPDLVKEDLLRAPAPLWITDLHPEHPLGIVCPGEEGTFWIDLPDSFERYLSDLDKSSEKRFRTVLRKNGDLTVRCDSGAAVENLWDAHVARLDELALKAGGEAYTADELAFRRELYAGRNIRNLAIYLGDELLGVNVSYWDAGTVYDLACIIKPVKQALRRSLGAFAILKNVEWAIDSHMRRYDLLSRDYGYKRAFGAREVPLKCIIICSERFADAYGIAHGLYFESVNQLLERGR